jgi:hypothetical protein
MDGMDRGAGDKLIRRKPSFLAVIPASRYIDIFMRTFAFLEDVPYDKLPQVLERVIRIWQRSGRS